MCDGDVNEEVMKIIRERMRVQYVTKLFQDKGMLEKVSIVVKLI